MSDGCPLQSGVGGGGGGASYNGLHGQAPPEKNTFSGWSMCYRKGYGLRPKLVLINRARGLYGRILTEVASTDRTQ